MQTVSVEALSRMGMEDREGMCDTECGQPMGVLSGMLLTQEAKGSLADTCPSLPLSTLEV